LKFNLTHLICPGRELFGVLDRELDSINGHPRLVCHLEVD